MNCMLKHKCPTLNHTVEEQLKCTDQPNDVYTGRKAVVEMLESEEGSTVVTVLKAVDLYVKGMR